MEPQPIRLTLLSRPFAGCFPRK
nr:unnamed protein product [Callosobruchus analis]